MIQNGPVPFVHPATGRRIGPYDFYEGNAHQEHENLVEEDDTQIAGDKKLEGDQTSEDENGEKSPEGDEKSKGKKKPKEGE